MKPIYIIILLITLALTAACSSEDSSPILRQDDLQIQTQTDTWTYVSLESGKTVGTSALGDSVAETAWRQRTDWDVAFCNGMIRTNSGSSGAGKGGIVSISPDNYDIVDLTIENEYMVDTDTTQIW